MKKLVVFFCLCKLFRAMYIYIDEEDINKYKVRFVGEEALHKEDITWGKRSLRIK